jgi:phospholipid/cholesterol/gamma-HCH transport system permease protein
MLTLLKSLFRLMFAGLGEHLRLFINTLRYYRYIGRRRSVIVADMERSFFGAFPVVVIVAVFTGMVLAFQSGKELARYGQEANIGILVSVSMCREMGPEMTAYILAGLIGSTIAAELGTMKVSEEVDALAVMAINPVHFLFLPRIVSLAILAPILTIYTNIIGIFGGALVGKLQLGVSYYSYFDGMLEFVTLTDIYSGLFKSFIFGLSIAVIGCVQGINAENGAAGVGRATMKSVVVSFVTILIFDFFLKWIFY